MKRILTCLITICLTLMPTMATDNYVFKTFDVRTGLSDNYVKSILRDQYGFMWLATSNGLNRYDGYQFKKYTVTQLGNYNDDIECIQEDGAGTLWIQTLHYIFIYNREQDRIEDNASEKFQQLGINDSITTLYVDDDHNLWAASSRYLYKYDFRDKALVTIGNLNHREIICITVRHGQAYTLMTDGDFQQVDLRSRQLKPIGHIDLSTNRWHWIYLDTKGKLWFYTAHSSTDRLKCYDITTKRWIEYPALASLNHTILTSIMDDEEGHLWIGTENEGICLYDYQTEKVTMISRNDKQPYPLPSNHIISFFKDDDDVMWIGMSKRGVAYVDLSPQPFTINRMTGKEDISCMIDDGQGNIWIGYDGDGMVRLDKDGRQTYYNNENGTIPSNLITCSLLDQSGTLWLGTFGDGILYLNRNRFEKYDINMADGQKAIYISSLTEDEHGNLWFGTLDNGVICRQRDGIIRTLNMDNSELRTPTITCLLADKLGHIYIGTSTGFYIHYIKQNKILLKTKNQQRLTEEIVTALYKNKDGLIWIGTRTGLRIYDEKSDSLYSLTETDGLSNGYIRGLIEDEDQNLWVSTDNGLTCIKTQKGTTEKGTFVCKPFLGGEGLENAIFNHNAVCLTKAGDCLIGSSLGYIKINKEALTVPHSQVHIMFTALTINNQLVEVSDEHDVLECNIQLTKSISLDYDQNNFAIDISAMNYNKQQKTFYLYRLKELGENWIALSGNQISFNALAPGSYTLEVKASDLGGWTSEVSELEITIKPPFWQSIPAYILYILILAAIIYYFMQRQRKKHQETLAIQKLEMELEQQHQMEEDKMRFFTNVSHDLKTPLSLIITPLEKLLSGNIEKQLRVELDLIWRNARLLMDEVSQLLDLRRLDAGAEELNISHGDFTEFLRKIVESFRYYAESRGIDLNLRINVTHLEMDFDRNKMRRVIMNLLSNAFKYNKPNGSITITLGKHTTQGQTMMQLKVADTGIGIKDENKEHIFDRFYQEENDSEYMGSGIGLHIVKEYVILHKGEIKIEDNHPQGTVFIVAIPIGSTAIETNGSEVSESEEYVPKALSGTQSEQVTILVVEDNKDFCQFLERCLIDEYHILTANNGKEALNVLAQNTVNIVISDIMMPEMNGLELCNHIKTDTNFSHIPVILLTAKSTEENIISGLKDGADEYITKPFNLSILKLRIKKILEWTTNNHRQFTKSIDISPSDITVSSLDEELIRKAIQVVEEHMDDSDYSVEDLSVAVGMTRGHLYKKLMAITGQSPLEFIRILRIKRGRALLEQGKTNISEVAYTVGFSPKQFSKYFKEEYGVLPSEFLRSNIEK